MESIRARCSQCLMKSMFVFRQRYILLGPFPKGLLRTHMEVICLNSLAEKEIRGVGIGLGIWGLEISLRGWDYMSLGGTANWGFCEKFKELQVRFQCVFRGFMEVAA